MEEHVEDICSQFYRIEGWWVLFLESLCCLSLWCKHWVGQPPSNSLTAMGSHPCMHGGTLGIHIHWHKFLIPLSSYLPMPKAEKERMALHLSHDLLIVYCMASLPVKPSEGGTSLHQCLLHLRTPKRWTLSQAPMRLFQEYIVSQLTLCSKEEGLSSA